MVPWMLLICCLILLCSISYTFSWLWISWDFRRNLTLLCSLSYSVQFPHIHFLFSEFVDHEQYYIAHESQLPPVEVNDVNENEKVVMENDTNNQINDSMNNNDNPNVSKKVMTMITRIEIK